LNYIVIYEKVGPICLLINKDVRFTTIAFLQVALFTGGSRLMQISLVRISLLRFFKTFHKYLPYANLGLFISLVQFFGQNIWLMNFFGYLFHCCDLPYANFGLSISLLRIFG
jgi:hypothetical protein